ncbi:hypothetical protein [Actinomadura sp. 7K507]|uniref:hypothetical protein n=1 Tax=Actinomadura sp. 7K507 TaxID=2530365 RepID=UPI00104FB646|nr:hypothetical protein [Actinomadura sp. 7K507]TDC91399.1 hypothetical protein E1285_13000 [Actinomadura sp. 7K507]
MAGAPSRDSKPGARPVPEESKAYYNIVHLYGGIFVQGAETVVSPATPGSSAPPGPTMRKAGERLKKLSELAEKIRALN